VEIELEIQEQHLWQKGFCDNSSLEKLKLSFNRIKTTGATALATSLLVNSTLKELDLKLNDIGTRVIRVLARTIRFNKTLVNIGICGGNTDYEGQLELLDAVRKNSTLEHLEYIRCYSDKDVIQKEINEITRWNKKSKNNNNNKRNFL